MLKQTRNALIYSDLALFLLDTREGINYNDVAMYKWLSYHKMRLPNEMRNRDPNEPMSQGELVEEEERYKQILLEEEKYTIRKDVTQGGSI